MSFFSRAAFRPVSSVSSRLGLNLHAAARSSSRPHHHLRSHQQLVLRQPYSSSSSSSPNTSSHYNRSQFKVLPFLALFVVGSGSYVLLVKARTGQRKPTPSTPESS